MITNVTRIYKRQIQIDEDENNCSKIEVRQLSTIKFEEEKN